MIHIKLNEAIFHPTTGKEPFKAMTAQQKVKCFYTIESSGSEIGYIPFSPPLNRGSRRKPAGQNSGRTINISLNTLSIDETLFPDTYMETQGFMVNRLVAAIADGIVQVTHNDNATPMTASAFGALFPGY